MLTGILPADPRGSLSHISGAAGREVAHSVVLSRRRQPISGPSPARWPRSWGPRTTTISCAQAGRALALRVAARRRKGRKLGREPGSEIVEDRPGLRLPDLDAPVRGRASGLLLHGVELGDPADRFLGDGGALGAVHVDELATDMGEAGDLADLARAVARPEPRRERSVGRHRAARARVAANLPRARGRRGRLASAQTSGAYTSGDVRIGRAPVLEPALSLKTAAASGWYERR